MIFLPEPVTGRVMTAPKSIGIIANSEKPDAAEYSMRLAQWLKERSVEVVLESEIAAVTGQGPAMDREALTDAVDMIVAFGGDGTLLRAARSAGRRPVPIVGINLGGLGFMTVVNLNELFEAMESIIRGRYSVSRRMMLDVTVKGETYTALNDVVIDRGHLLRMIYLETFIDGKYLTIFKADGLIISTPTGSTAYSLSAGGPIVFPELLSIIINPICPHALTNRPIMVPPDAVVDLVLLAAEEGTRVTMDGQLSCSLETGNSLRIARSRDHILLVNSPYHDYLEILRTKLGWGGRP